LIYRLLFKLVLRRIDPERAHALASRSLRAIRATALGRAVVRHAVGQTDERLRVRALGLTFPSPVGVAAGVDKDATWFEELGALGFGFIEVGTVTAVGQEGNPRPRVTRLIEDRALLNRMGFPNPGARIVADRLRRRSGQRPIVGVNIGKSRNAALDEAGADYRASVREVAPWADYLVINVSSPNTPGLRQMQAVELLRPLIEDVRSELRATATQVPLLVKIGPDLDEDGLEAVARLALELELDGIVAVNTAAVEGGGISGAPLKGRALATLSFLHARVGDRMVLISVGGIETPDDAWERIRAGATLVQAYTGFVYGGPGWPRRMNRELARRVSPGAELSLSAVRSQRA
jgi:dihydroorotate dehydrogenase